MDGWQAVPGEDPDGDLTSHVTLDGAVVWSHESGIAVLQVHEVRFLLKGRVEQVGQEDYRRRPLPGLGERARVHASLYVMPGGEYDPFDDAGVTSPDVARDWRVDSVSIERRAMNGPDCGAVTRVEPVERMRCWDDEAPGVEYLLDVPPMVRGTPERLRVRGETMATVASSVPVSDLLP